MGDISDDDDVPTLSAGTLKALQEFYREQEEKESQLNQTNENGVAKPNEIVFNEDWQLSQFWYDSNTVETLVRGIVKSVEPNGRIALVSCPTLYKRLKEEAVNCEIKLFEYDKRFSVFGNDFHLYDYKSPLDIDKSLSSYFDLVVADPPFLSEECLTKTAITMKYLTKQNVVLCTGAVMAELAQRLLHLKKCEFEPKHQNNLANEFWCFSNFDFDAMLKS